MSVFENLVAAAEPRSRKEEILAELNDQQKQPVINFEGPSIIIAGAGAGKTKTVVSRVAYMIESGVPASKILVFTFTNKAAKELKTRVAGYLGAAAERVTVSTYHSFCVRLLRQYVEELNVSWNRNFSIFDEDDVKVVLTDVLTGMGGTYAKMKPNEVRGTISKWKERMVSPIQAEQSNDDSAKVAGQVYRHYQEAMAKQNAFDFDDLIYMVIRLFERCPEVLETVNRMYTYVTADESQDSSERDLRLIEYLGGKAFNVCLVGDDYQSEEMLLMRAIA